MSARFLGSLLGLAVVLVSSEARAQRVVVLELHNDRSGKLRMQVERALRKSGSVEVLSLRHYKVAAAKRKFSGSRAMTPDAVAQTAKALRLDAAVVGSGGKSIRIQVWDSSGAQVSAVRFPLRRGLMSEPNAVRLAQAVVQAVGGKRQEPGSGSPRVEAPRQLPARREEPAATPPKTSAAETTEAERENQQREELAEAHTVSPPPVHPSDESKKNAESLAEVKAKGPRIGPKLIAAQITGTTTWRSYCSRPGFSSCSQYNATDPSLRPTGDTVDFKAEVPYVGFSLSAELFPFFESRSLLQGLGVMLGYERGFSQTNVKVVTSSGATQDRQVYAADQGINALAAFRFFFTLGQKEPLLGYAGVHGGFGTRRFDVDSAGPVILPGSHRNYPLIGLDISVPIFKFFRVEGSGNYLVSPKPSSSEINDYGSGASSSGWSGDLGLAGSVWGPLGYVVRLRYSRYKDQFTGAGAKWQDGGAAEESYLGVYWGVSAQF